MTETADRLSYEQVVRAQLLPEVFVDEHCWVERKEGGAPVPFHLWDFQYDTLEAFQECARLIVLKARQLGLSWLALAYVLWLVSFSRGQTALFFSRREDDAIELVRRVKFMWRRLPPELQVPILGGGSTRKLEFPQTGSRILAFPSAEDAGSSYTGTFVLMDEWSKVQWAETLHNAVMGTLSAGGTFVGVSTAKGYANFFADMWLGCVHKLSDDWAPPEPGEERDESEFVPLFIPSSAHPERDDGWHRRKRREFKTVRAFQQEYPETWQDAFQEAGDICFDEFDRGQHHALFEVAEQWPTWRGIDFGFHHAPCIWAQVIAKKHVHVFAEHHGEKTTTDQLAQSVVARDRQLGLTTSQVPAGVDPAGIGVNTQTSETDIAVLSRHGIRVHDPEKRYSPKDRVELIKQLLTSGRLTVDTQACPTLTAALERAKWDRHGKDGPPKETYAKDGTYDHWLDALGYMVVKIFPPRGTPAGARTKGIPAATRSYGGANFG